MTRPSERPDRRPDPAETVAADPGRYTTVDEAGMESFPASDPIAVTDDHPIAQDENEISR